MTSEEILKKVQGILTPSQKTEEVSMAELITADGLTIYFDGELTVGAAVWTIVEGENVALPVGEYVLPDGSKIVVAEAGIVSALMSAQETEKAPAPAVEPVAGATLSKADVSTMIVEALKPLLTQLEKLEEVEQENTELKTQLSREPAAEEIKENPEGNAKVNGIGVSLNSNTNKTGVNRVNEMLFNS